MYINCHEIFILTFSRCMICLQKKMKANSNGSNDNLVMGEPRAWLGRPARPKTFWLGSARSKLDVEARPGSSSPDEP